MGPGAAATTGAGAATGALQVGVGAGCMGAGCMGAGCMGAGCMGAACTVTLVFIICARPRKLAFCSSRKAPCASAMERV